MRFIGFLIVFFAVWAFGSGSGAPIAAQTIDPYGPWARVVAAVAAVALGVYLLRFANTVSVLLGAALIGAGFSLWLPIERFLDVVQRVFA